MDLIIGSDHAGYDLKEACLAFLDGMDGYNVTDVGVYGRESADYPQIAREVAEAVSHGQYPRGILICGSGIGMSMAANRYRGVRAALCHDELSAQISRDHNDTNVLCLSGDQIGEVLLRKIVEAWVNTEFSGGRHQRRVNKITAIEEGRDPREVTNG